MILFIHAGGNTQLIDAVFDSFTFNANAEMLSDRRETPLHLAVKTQYKKDVSTKVLLALLERDLLDPYIKDQHGKRPIDYLSKRDGDDRHNMLKEAMVLQYKKNGRLFPGYESLPPDEKLDILMDIIVEKVPSDSQPVQSAEQYHPGLELFNLSPDSMHKRQQCILKVEDQIDTSDVKVKEKDEYKRRATKVCTGFDTLLWEVEVTPKVVDFFKDTKRNAAKDRLAAARTICKLAEGRRSDRLSKQVSNNKSLHLFEARMTHGSRILWEEAISYSAKLSSQTEQVYSRVIRIWEVVLSHDDLGRRIRQIERSHRRGSEASLNFKWSLMSQKEIKHGERSIPDKFNIPITEEDRAQAEHRFIPAASTKDDQYNVATFHSFDASTVKSLLLRANNRMEFPFKEWQQENEIVRLKTKESILLLGRSGTGKTMCCLYRLWNEFNGFWNPELNTANLKITRKCFHSPSILNGKPGSEGIDQKQCVTELDSANESDLSIESTGCLSSEFSLASTHDQNQDMLLCLADMDSKNHSLPTSNDQTAVIDGKNTGASCLLDERRIKENLHQVFLTKNRVLCDYMKTSFYNMAAAHDFLKSHMKYETEVLPNSLSQICNEAFPLFLTARQFFILLDNSLGDTSNSYFPRDKDGNMCIKITSTDYDDDYRKMVMRLQDNAASSPTKQWFEVTALYFKDHIWRKIFPQHAQKGKGKGKEFEPMLVWTEIQSFIKGSESALRKGRPLNLEEYKILGDRMAPSYAAHRDAIYDIFMKYQEYQHGQRHIVRLYDECDLIFSIYNRLKSLKDVPWSIHSLFVDEVQDFTQAELAVLVHCTRDNSVFFTGDTAQTIARGISFRFEDIQSLFHHIAESNPKVSVPKLHHLTLNFRSHSGILGLAGSIVDIIKEFFDHSIDNLPNDVSMLPGPTPVIVESCEVGDLALLLRANKREVSPIEFGSHQVILVQSQQARKYLPRILKGALVFTIYEAKGLEFDDVLLYNFFSDSMVSLDSEMYCVCMHNVYHK
jgi:hypothetical protein